jgi:O-acetyl-ADP-ribose deacetylase
MNSPSIADVEGDLLDQNVDVIVNAWNRNIIPWWLLLPQGVSGAIKRKGGTAPFKELRKYGAIPLGQAVLTSAGRLPFKAIVHVAGINMLWRASEKSIRDSVKNAVSLAHENGFTSIAIPLIGAGSGGFNQERTKALMLDELDKLDVPMKVVVVAFTKQGTKRKGCSYAFDKFLASTSITYEMWHEGVPYYLEALRQLTADEQAEVVRRLGARWQQDWRDVEVYDAVGTPIALEALKTCLRDRTAGTRIAAAEKLRYVDAAILSSIW